MRGDFLLHFWNTPTMVPLLRAAVCSPPGKLILGTNNALMGHDRHLKLTGIADVQVSDVLHHLVYFKTSIVFESLLQRSG